MKKIMMDAGKEKRLAKAEHKLMGAMAKDKKADAGVTASLKAAMKHCKDCDK